MKNILLTAVATIVISLPSLLAQPQLRTIITPLDSLNTISDYVWKGNSIIVLGAFKHEIARSSDLGEHWVRNNVVTKDTMSQQYNIFSAPDNILFVTGNRIVNNGVFGGGWEEGEVYKSTNGGSTWQDVSPMDTMMLGISAVHFLDANVGFVTQVTGTNEQRLWKTTNGGTSWTATLITSHYLNDLFFDNNGNGWFTTYDTKSRVNTSSDGGETWRTVELGEYSTNSILSLLSKLPDGYMYLQCQKSVSGKSYYLLKSNDGFTTYDVSPTTLPVMLLDASGRAWYWKTASVDGAWVSQLKFSDDKGVNWSDVPAWDSTLQIQMLTVHNDTLLIADGRKLHLLTNFLTPSTVKNASIKEMLSVYPNPANNTVSIELPHHTQAVNISISDAVGNTLFSTRTEDNIFQWNTTDANGIPVANGIYRIVVNLNGVSLTAPLVVLR